MYKVAKVRVEPFPFHYYYPRNDAASPFDYMISLIKMKISN